MLASLGHTHPIRFTTDWVLCRQLAFAKKDQKIVSTLGRELPMLYSVLYFVLQPKRNILYKFSEIEMGRCPSRTIMYTIRVGQWKDYLWQLQQQSGIFISRCRVS